MAINSSHISRGIKIFSLLATIILAGKYLSAQSLQENNALYAFDLKCKGALEGFSQSNNQNNYTYQSLQGNCDQAMITRAVDNILPIDWNTAPVPEGYSIQDGATFLFLTDKDLGEVHSFNLFVNDEKKFTFGKKDQPDWVVKSNDGGVLSYHTFALDANGDSRGYMTLYAPSSWLQQGKPLHLKIKAVPENSNAWFMIFKSKDALQYLHKRADYEAAFRVSCVLKEGMLDVKLEAPLRYQNQTLQFSVDNMSQKVAAKFNDSTILYHAKFDTGKMKRKGLVLKVFNKDRFLFSTDTLFAKQGTYTVSEDGMIMRSVAAFSSPRWQEIIQLQYSPQLSENLAGLSNRKYAVPSFFLMNSSHQDIAWMDSPAKCELMRDTLVITPLLKRMKADPDYHFDIEDVLMIREYVKRHPDRKTLIRHFLDNGQLNVGGAFNMPYEDMYGAESLVREFYLGARWMHKNFNYWPTTYWNVDVPGRTLQMPQILSKSGIKMMILSRMEMGLFNWKSPDGSDVLTYSPGHYGDLFFAFRDKNNLNHGFNYLCDFSGTMEKDIAPKVKNKIPIPLLWDMDMASPDDPKIVFNEWDRINALVSNTGDSKKTNIPKIRYGSSSQLYDLLKKNQNELSSVKGERPDVWLYIHGPSHERALHASRDADILLPAAEKFATISSLLDGNFKRYPVKQLEEAWEAKIYPDHGWGGKNGEITDNFFLQKFLFARQEGRRLLHDALEHIAGKIEYRKDNGIPVVVFNALSWSRNAPVNADIKFSRGETFGITMKDAHGKDIPVQLRDEQLFPDGSLQSVKITFVARNVPSLGYSTFYVQTIKEKIRKNISASDTNAVFESDNYRIRLGKGGLSSIFDKDAGQELLNTSKFMGAEIFTMHSVGNGAGEFADIQQPDMEGFDKTSLHTANWHVISDGPVFTAISYKCPVRYADVQMTVILYKHLKRIDFKAEINNWEGVLYREFRMALPLKMQDTKVAYQVPFGILRVGEDELPRAAGERYTTDCRKVHPRGIESWIGATGKGISVTLSSDVAVADYVDPTANPVGYTILQPILFASRRSCHGEGNEYLQTGDHHFTFSLTSGTDDLSEVNKQGVNNHVPLFAVVNPSLEENKSLAEDGSFLKTDNKNVIITALKKAEDQDKICIRLYNTSGINQKYCLHLFKKMISPVRTDIIERPIQNVKQTNTGTSEMEIDKYGIETLVTGCTP